MEIQKERIKKILCIKLKGIGDVILSTVVLENLRHDFPDAQIDYLTEPPSRSVLEFLPYIRNLILFDKNEPLSSLVVLAKVMKQKYDLILDFYSNPRTALITRLSGAAYRAGFPYRGRTYAYNCFGPAERDKYHAAQLHLEMLSRLELSSYDKNLHFGLTLEDEEFANAFFAQNALGEKPVVVLSPSGGWQSKKCDTDKFAEIGHEIVRTYDVTILVVWGPEDKNDAEEIVKLIRKNALMAPETSLRKMAALMKRAAFVVANDSGPMHIAVAVRTPVLSLHGPTDPKLQGPFGDQHENVRLDELDCIGCNLLVCNKKHECFKNLPLPRVMDKINSLILKNNLTIARADETV
jgi:ADP-heptose:LPS heptosyltransferase